MLKSICIFLIIFSFTYFSGCQKDTSPITITPVWLNEFIENIENDHAYYGANITRYEWKEKYYYDVFVASRSCFPCEVYDQTGQLMIWNDSSAIDYVNNRKNGFVVWSWRDKK